MYAMMYATTVGRLFQKSKQSVIHVVQEIHMLQSRRMVSFVSYCMHVYTFPVKFRRKFNIHELNGLKVEQLMNTGALSNGSCVFLEL